MLHTYKATLHGDRLEWSDAPPDELAQNRPVAVYVTILEESQHPVERAQTGQQMAAILEQLANMNAFAEIADPAAWEREIRSDRVLVDRDS
jgi:hypothetical protein